MTGEDYLITCLVYFFLFLVGKKNVLNVDTKPNKTVFNISLSTFDHRGSLSRTSVVVFVKFRRQHHNSYVQDNDRWWYSDYRYVYNLKSLKNSPQLYTQPITLDLFHVRCLHTIVCAFFSIDLSLCKYLYEKGINRAFSSWPPEGILSV